MKTFLQFGEAPPLALSVRDEVCILPQMESDGVPLDDVEGAAMTALREPVGFPPLTQAVVDGDHVALAMGEGVRGGAEVVRAVVRLLRDVPIPPAQISVVVGSQEEAARLERGLTDLRDEGLSIAIHDPHDNEGLVFVAAVGDQPLRLNRHLGEADFVIPVACARHEQGFDVRGPFAALFPRFSDAETIARTHDSPAPTSKGQLTMRREDADRAGWLLGVTLVVETVPARGGGVAAVVAGEPGHVAHAANSWCERIWQVAVPERANLVVTSLGGGPEEQTWVNVARAIHSARRVSDATAGAIVLCTEVEHAPSPVLRTAADAQESEAERQALARRSGDEAAQAWELCQALERGPVYFMGRLPESTVEELGMAPLADFEELTRLVSRSGTCLVLNDGHHTVPVVRG